MWRSSLDVWCPCLSCLQGRKLGLAFSEPRNLEPTALSSPANTSLNAQAEVSFWQKLRIPIGDLTHHLQPSEGPKWLPGPLHMMRCSLWSLQQAFVKKRKKVSNFPNLDHFCKKNWIQVTRRDRLFKGITQRTRDKQCNKSLKQRKWKLFWVTYELQVSHGLGFIYGFCFQKPAWQAKGALLL